MSSSEFVTRAEFNALANRVDFLDEHGTRGIGALQIQVTELTKDITRVEANQETHAKTHEREARERKASHRWLIASVIIPTVSALVAAAGVVAYLHP